MSKRWNQKGSGQAKRRMSELRERKCFLTRREERIRLANDWARVTGRPYDEWWNAAQEAGLRHGCGVDACIAFLRKEIAKRS